MLTELVELMRPEALKPYLTPIIGKVIRVASDRFPDSVKAAILGLMGVVSHEGTAVGACRSGGRVMIRT
jgi:hypothetical protein